MRKDKLTFKRVRLKIGEVTGELISSNRNFINDLKQRYFAFVTLEKPTFSLLVEPIRLSNRLDGRTDYPIENGKAMILKPDMKIEKNKFSMRRFDIDGSFDFKKKKGSVVLHNYPDDLKPYFDKKNKMPIGKTKPLMLFLQTIYAYYYAKSKGFLLHSSAIKKDGKAYVFVGLAGAGKSTIARLAILKGYTILNDEAPLILKRKNKFFVYSTPFGGDIRPIENTSAELKALFVISKSKKAAIKKANPENYLDFLISMSITYFFVQKQYTYNDFLLESLINTPLFRLYNERNFKFLTLIDNLKL